jgi:hypothetical protein
MLSSRKSFVICSAAWRLLFLDLQKAIACLLTGAPIKGKIKKMGDCSRIAIQKEKSLRCKDKKSGAKENVHAAV